jgi:hypothetical protein
MTEGPFLEHYTSTKAGSSEVGIQPFITPIARLGAGAVTWSGSSGGALVNAEGVVVGVVTSGIPDYSESYSTAIEHLRLLLQKAQNDANIPAGGWIVRSIGQVVANTDGVEFVVEELDNSDQTIGSVLARASKEPFTKSATG